MLIENLKEDQLIARKNRDQIKATLLTTLIGEVLADPDLAHSDVFRRMLQAGLQDLVDAEAAVKIGRLSELSSVWMRLSRKTTFWNGGGSLNFSPGSVITSLISPSAKTTAT